ncbi:protein ABHD14B-like isoform X1 [Homarus americanus]|uniref:protein ABHD14B-like isoform X1 n=2 Tax=Homarus americanus TaxID=6706 RepID=UPI001C48B4DA|nr:protein ABHD14B-like isoform X1 [Homarus americanus]XP_042240764.1 protein ABHD14B-like isoform X1 [Homarus americanus]
MAPSLMLPKLTMTPFRVMALVAGVAAVCLVFSALTTTGRQAKLGKAFEQVSTLDKRDLSGRTMAEPNFWRNFDFRSEQIPSQVNEAAQKVHVTNHTINIMGSNTFYREAQPPEGVASSGEVVVLLHGAAFNSKTWLDLHTIDLLAGMGHRVIAIDLPGFGKTPGPLTGDRADYLHSLLSNLKVTHPILVSPSMSGQFSILFINKYPQDLAGFVPVAPVSTQLIKEKAPELRVPTLIIYGENDRTLGHSSRDDLLRIPTSQDIEIPQAKHPAYLDNPNLFHTLLYNFIKQVHAHRASA